MSITALLLLAPVSAQVGAVSTEARYNRLTRVALRCGQPEGQSAIVVCGKRAADKWRVPFLDYDIGDPRAESVSRERNRLASEPRPNCGTTAMFAQAKCRGGVGVSTKIGIGTGAAGLRLRPIAE